ncbi:MAG: hypothetical protein AAGF57_07535 [Pseudomonadota bacterium]
MLNRTLRTVLIPLLLALTPAAYAVEPWSGMYLAIDPADGSLDRLSISANKDKTFTIRGSVTQHTDCFKHTGVMGGAWFEAVGKIEGDRLVREQMKLFCAEQEKPISMPDASYIYNELSDTLSFAIPGGERVLIFHRID